MAHGMLTIHAITMARRISFQGAMSRLGCEIPRLSQRLLGEAQSDARRAIRPGAQRIYIILPSTGTINRATMLMILMSGLMAGPAVSL